MSEKLTKEELLEKAKKPGEDALKLHPFYRGKIEIVSKCAVRDFSDFAIWYTPGVAQPCRVIEKNKEAVYDNTNKWNTVAVVSDGTRVLGLGDIGPEAALPVMEGKAKPKCFYVLDRLREEMDIPVWHDDQQGTAAITLAALFNALKIVGKNIDKVKISMIGAGAANMAIARLLISAGVVPGNIIMTDSKGILHPDRKDIDREKNKHKWDMCLKSNSERRKGDTREAMEGADVCIACSRPGPGTIKPEWVKGMAKDAVVFACANPIPEIWPWEAKEAGARIVATGRSDFPNQVNNSLGFPGIFRGALDVRARTITDEMCIAAAEELAKCAEDKGLSEEYIVPTMDEWEVFPREATAG